MKTEKLTGEKLRKQFIELIRLNRELDVNYETWLENKILSIEAQMSSEEEMSKEFIENWCPDPIQVNYKRFSEALNKLLAQTVAVIEAQMPTRYESEAKIASINAKMKDGIRGIKSPAMMLIEYDEWFRGRIKKEGK